MRTLTALPLISLLALTGLTGCSSEDDAAAGKPQQSSSATGQASRTPTDAGTINNCGFTQTFDTAPERIFTIKSTSTELVVALGLKDKLVGTAFNDGPVVDVQKQQPVEVPIVSEKAPDKETVLQSEPDLVIGGWESNFAGDTAGERDTLATLGVASYVSPAACQEPEHQPRPMTFDKLFAQFGEAGRILGAEQAASDLVAAQKAELAKVAKAAPETTALWWSSGEDTPFVGGGIGAPQMVLDAVGLTNVNAENPKTWDSMGWEAIVDADPDVIVLVDAAWNTAESKIKALTSNGATKNLTAVRKKQFLIIPFPAAEAGVRSVSAATDLSAQLGELDLLAP